MKSEMFAGKYYFHLHTHYTDGKPAVRDYFVRAREESVQNVIFLEHVRRNPKYEVKRFADEVRSVAKEFGIRGTVGLEAKILPDGSVDIDERDLEQADVLGIAEHGFPDDPQILVQAFEGICSWVDQTAHRLPIVWAHPGLWFQKRGIDLNHPLFLRMMDRALASAFLFERNLHYDLLTKKFADRVPPHRLVIGLNAHTLDDLQLMERAWE